MKERKTRAKKKVSFTFDEDVYEALKAIADYNRTTMSQWLTDRVMETVRETKEINLTEYFR